MANMFGTVDRSRLEHMRKLIGDMSDRALQTKQIAVKMEEDIAAKKKQRLEEEGAAQTLQRYAGVLRGKVKDRQPTPLKDVYETVERPLNSEERNKYLSDAIVELAKYGQPGVKSAEVLSKAFTRERAQTLEQAFLDGVITADQFKELKFGDPESRMQILNTEPGSKPGSLRVTLGTVENGAIVKRDIKEIGGDSSSTGSVGYREQIDTKKMIKEYEDENKKLMSMSTRYANKIYTDADGNVIAEEAVQPYLQTAVSQMNANELRIAELNKGIKGRYLPKTHAIKPESNQIVVVDDPNDENFAAPDWYTGPTVLEQMPRQQATPKPAGGPPKAQPSGVVRVRVTGPNKGGVAVGSILQIPADKYRANKAAYDQFSAEVK